MAERAKASKKKPRKAAGKKPRTKAITGRIPNRSEEAPADRVAAPQRKSGGGGTTRPPAYIIRPRKKSDD